MNFKQYLETKEVPPWLSGMGLSQSDSDKEDRWLNKKSQIFSEIGNLFVHAGWEPIKEFNEFRRVYPSEGYIRLKIINPRKLLLDPTYAPESFKDYMYEAINKYNWILKTGQIVIPMSDVDKIESFINEYERY